MTQLLAEPGSSYRLHQRFPGHEPSGLVNEVASPECVQAGTRCSQYRIMKACTSLGVALALTISQSARRRATGIGLTDALQLASG
jgi:hypothetical protein